MRDSIPPANRPFRLGSRGSALALAQTAVVTHQLHSRFPDHHWDIEVIRTEGDIDKVSPLTEIGGRGVFTNALQDALVGGAIEGAVHSAKDLPTTLAPDAPIVAFPDRDDPCDVLVSRHGLPLDRLPPRPVIGTSSRRREVQIRRLRPDAHIVSLRGNIDTRLRKAAGDDLDAIVLAAAGLRRMGWEARVTEFFPVHRLIPAPAQGALAIQGRAGSAAANLLAAIDDPAVAEPVQVERAFLAALGAGCTIPVGAFAERRNGETWLLAMLATLDGSRMATIDEPLDMGRELEHAAELAQRVRAEIGFGDRPRARPGWREGDGRLDGARVVVTRPKCQAAALARELIGRGAEVIALPTIRIVPVVDSRALDAALRDAAAGGYRWLVFSSVNAVDAVASRLEAIGIPPQVFAGVAAAAVGPVTAEAVTRLGLDVTLTSDEGTAGDLALALAPMMRPGERVLFPRSDIGRETIPEILRARGAVVDTIAAYRTVAETDVDPDTMSRVRSGAFDVVTFTSPSSVRYFVEMVSGGGWSQAGVRAVCVGPVSAAAAREAGFSVVAVAGTADAPGIAEAVAAYWRGAGYVKQKIDPVECSTMNEVAERSTV